MNRQLVIFGLLALLALGVQSAPSGSVGGLPDVGGIMNTVTGAAGSGIEGATGAAGGITDAASGVTDGLSAVVNLNLNKLLGLLGLVLGR